MDTSQLKMSCDKITIFLCVLYLYAVLGIAVASGINSTDAINNTISNDSAEMRTDPMSLNGTLDTQECDNCSSAAINATDITANTSGNESLSYTNDSVVTTTPRPSPSLSSTPNLTIKTTSGFKENVSESVDSNTTIKTTPSLKDVVLKTLIGNSSDIFVNTTFENETTVSNLNNTTHSSTSGSIQKGDIHHRKYKPHLTKEQYEYLVRHFTGFMPNVKVGNPPGADSDEEGAIDDGPFGSILWTDRKYLVSVLIPIGVGITGAMLIIVLAYATRVCRHRKVAERNPRTLLQPSVSRPDDIMLLDQSSDDEF